MRVYCKECGGKGHITKPDHLTLQFARIYCRCNSVECGHTWVATVEFSHTLSPSAKAVDQMLFDRLKDMPRAKQRELFEQLGAA